ncbi:MAG: alpha-L-fucosidase [Planctomycetes bacterium]|nr:alpha-L-fucosidase [Planctomycetota bacterium]
MVAARRRALTGLLLSLVLAIAVRGAVVFETEWLSIQIDDTGAVRGLVDRRGGVNYGVPPQPAPLLALRTDGQFQMPKTLHAEKSTGTLTLQYAEGVTAIVKAVANTTHVTFELLSVQPPEKVEVVVWGPYPTAIKEVIGETVGVVRNDRFALGIQALNVKTLGGYPTAENDIMPGRGDTAQPMEFGSVLQAFTRERRQERVISNWGHKSYLVPGYDDGGVMGSKIALFGCPADQALRTIGAIELAEGLPHPLIDGVWGKVAPGAAASYLIVGFGEDTIGEAIALTKRAGLQYLYHGGPFSTWGHFQLNPSQFPHGWPGLKDCADKAAAQGVRLGAHTLSNFITTNDPYVTPVPDDRLAKVGSSVLTEDIVAEQREIPVADPKWFNQMENNTLKTVQIGRELILYESVSREPPWRLLGCRRGVYQTQAAAHPKGTLIAKLMDHAYKVFLTNAELSQEVARRLADLFNQTGLMQISFDGLEGNWSTGMGQYGRTLFVTTWYDHLRDDLRGRVINDASNPGHYFWHIYTRMNWGEPWYAGFRESQTEYRLKNQEYFRRNLMPCMLGWFNMTAQTSLEDIEWLLARAAGFDAGFALNTSLRVVQDNGRGESILQAIKAWETARMSGAFSESQKRRLQDIRQEFHLEALDEHSWNLYPVYSSQHTLAQQVQPGQPSGTTWELDNLYGPQPLQFILQVSGDTPISDLTLKIDDAEEIPVPVTLQPGSILKYSGTGQAVVYDKRWKELEKVVLNPSVLKVGPGRHRVTFGCRFQTADQPQVKIEFRLVGEAEKVVAGGTGESPPQKAAALVETLSGPQADSTREARLESWWRDAKFGLFVHWGPASLSGAEISWSMKDRIEGGPQHQRVERDAYMNLYRQFNPVNFDADEWMRLAKDAGMKYVVFVTKHHDGFSLWPTQQVRFAENAGLPPHYSIADTPYQRDLCRMIADAAHRHGLKLGWYYSTRDWTHPEYLQGDNGSYNRYYQAQVRELLSNYGQVDMMWFDHCFGDWSQYTLADLFQEMYRLQPDLLVNDRAARGLKNIPAGGATQLVRGDYDTPEQRIGTFQHGRAWESCVTMTQCADGGGWSYRADGRTRTLEECLRMLVSTVTGDGNLLLNIGPQPAGRFQPQEIANLQGIGQWLRRFGESIYGTRGGPYRNGTWGGSCYRDRTLYLHVFQGAGEMLRLAPLQARVLHTGVLGGGPIEVEQSGAGLTLVLPANRQDTTDTVIKLELDSPAEDEFINGRPLDVSPLLRD